MNTINYYFIYISFANEFLFATFTYNQAHFKVILLTILVNIESSPTYY